MSRWVLKKRKEKNDYHFDHQKLCTAAMVKHQEISMPIHSNQVEWAYD